MQYECNNTNNICCTSYNTINFIGVIIYCTYKKNGSGTTVCESDIAMTMIGFEPNTVILTLLERGP